MKIKVLASGSKGNSTYIETDRLKVLIDIGVTYQYLAQELNKINIDPHELDLILITHVHSDHIKGLQSLVKKTNLKVYITDGMKQVIEEKIPVSNIHLLQDNMQLEDLELSLIHTSHDVESVGYILSNNQKTIVYITDTGYINKKYIPVLENKDIYIIESNHDEKMLMEGPYPYILKQRVVGDKGHLSNHATAKLLSEVVGNKTKHIILAHISEHNNTEELAYQTTKETLEKKCIEKKIMIAKQYESLETIEV